MAEKIKKRSSYQGSSNLKRLYGKLDEAVSWVDRFELVLSVTLMILIVVINGMEIFCRYILDSSLFWVHEITILLGNWMYFIGVCLVYQRNRDIEIEFFVKFLSRSANRLLVFITNASIFYFLIILVFETYKLLLIQAKYTTHGLNIPNHLFSLPLFFGTLSMMFILIKRSLGIYLDLEN